MTAEVQGPSGNFDMPFTHYHLHDPAHGPGVIINLKVYYRKQLIALCSWYATVRNRKKTVAGAMPLQKSKDFADFWHRFHHTPVLALSMEENGHQV